MRIFYIANRKSIASTYRAPARAAKALAPKPACRTGNGYSGRCFPLASRSIWDIARSSTGQGASVPLRMIRVGKGAKNV